MKFLEITTGGGRVLRFSVLILLVFSFFLISSALGFTPQSFAPMVGYLVGDRPHNVVAADLNADGFPDLVTSNTNADSIVVLMNNGDGTFAAGVNYEVLGGPAVSCAGDFDLDVDLDVAVASHNGGFVRVFMNAGSGALVLDTDYTIATGGTHSVLSSDLDGDGDLDLVAGNRADNLDSTLGTISVLENGGTGAFGNIVNYPTNNLPHLNFAVDLDGDGDNEIIVSNLGVFPTPFTSSTVSVFVNNGDTSLTDSTFDVRVDYFTGFGPSSVIAFDYDADLDLDLAVANFSSHSVSILKNNGEGAITDSTFDDRTDYPTGKQPASAAAGDLDGDGWLDLVVTTLENFPNFIASKYVSVLKNNGDGTFADTVNFGTVARGPYSVLILDLDGDGDSDLVTNHEPADTLAVLINLLINQPPVLDPLAPETLYENSSLSFRVHFTDPDIYQASLTAPSLPESASFIDSGNTAGSFRFHPDTSQAGNYNIVFIASDGILADTDSVAITVLDCVAKPGDVDGNKSWSLTDIVGLVNIVFKSATKPTPLCRTDCNASGGNPNIIDVVCLVNKVFKGGANPVKIGACCL